MKIHIITIGQPKLDYAKLGWQEYLNRLSHFHDVRVTHISDKNNNDKNIVAAMASSFGVALAIEGQQLNSAELAKFLDAKAQQGKELSFVIGGPDGLSDVVLDSCDYKLSLSALTFPHDLAMVILLEALYRASSINANHPYHRA